MRIFTLPPVENPHTRLGVSGEEKIGSLGERQKAIKTPFMIIFDRFINEERSYEQIV
jgi:hypothetical protein